jgi:predicted nucleic acid-binding protein
VKYLLDTDHISSLQRRSGSEFTNLAARITQHSPADFALSVVSFHEQVLGAHTFINRAQTNTDVIRGYTPRLETFQAAQLGKKIYVLHSFQKKAKKGIATPKMDVDLISEAKELAKHEQ